MTRRRLLWIAALVVLAGLAWWAWTHRFGVPEDFDAMEDEYKYGSIGADHPLAQAPVPYWIWKVLPTLFPPATTIEHGLGPKNGRAGWDAFGLVGETRDDSFTTSGGGTPYERPIGFSRRRVLGMDFVGLNCSFCHLGTYQDAAPAADTKRHVVLGGTGTSVDIEQYFLYMFSALTSPRFTADAVLPAIDAELERRNAELQRRYAAAKKRYDAEKALNPGVSPVPRPEKVELGWGQRALLRWVLIPLLPTYLKHMERDKFDFIVWKSGTALPRFGPGRVDTWSLYKRVFLDPPDRDGIAGTVDFPSLWNQKAREGMRMHWDGNTDVLLERNVVSALSLVGARIGYLDFERLTRVTDWIVGLVPPRYEDRFPGGQAVDAALAARGARIFDEQCGRCHSPQGDRIGRVEPIEDLGTDPRRIDEFTPRLQARLNQLGTDQWQLRHFRGQHGYVNNLLDGIWLRAPYLHNGSVPTLRHLLEPPERRPARFCRGNEVYDWKNLGYESAPADGALPCGGGFLYDTAVPGNGNAGHAYGTSLPAVDKDALIEFMKTL